MDNQLILQGIQLNFDAQALMAAGQDDADDTSATLTRRRLTRAGVKNHPSPISSYNAKCTGLPDTYAMIIEQEGMPAVEALSAHIRHRWDRNQNIVEGVLTLVQLMGQLVAFWRAAPLHSVSVAVGTAGQAGYVAPVVQGQYAARHSPLAFYQMLAPLVDHLKGLFNYLDLKEGEGVHMNATSLQLLAVKGADMSVTEQQRRISQQLATAAQHSNRSNGGGAFHRGGGGGFQRGGGGGFQRGGRGNFHVPQQFQPAGFQQRGRGGGRGGGRGVDYY